MKRNRSQKIGTVSQLLHYALGSSIPGWVVTHRDFDGYASAGDYREKSYTD